jgi:ADP-ribosylglycohydrolase
MLPNDYMEKVYAGVLGKIIGVYVGRPFEGWLHDKIMSELGEIQYYVHDKLNRPLIVTDDDISGTFSFIRALPDNAMSRDVTPEQIGNGWLNLIIEKKCILWFGGMGNSTEHTAFLRLKHGIKAPQSGSIALNGKVVAEQIGAQIFIDGWGMAAAGDPELAADFARKAGSVSHDGEAIYGAQVIAAMEAQAFVESDINKLIDTGVSFIPKDSIIYRMIDDIREWHAEFNDWHDARDQIVANYGYDKYGGNCHMVPNHALIIYSLLYGDDDFQKSLMIVNTSGWDTDCNSGNVGCILGIKNGLTGIDAGPDWRGPVADRLYLPTADGGRAISDAVTETIHLVNMGRALAGEAPIAPKNGARFHFELPGAVQGFTAEDDKLIRIVNVTGHSASGQRSLAIHYTAQGGRVTTPTFTPPDALQIMHYELHASPTIYQGQTLRARISADSANAEAANCRLFIRVYGENDELQTVHGPEVALKANADHTFEWTIEGIDSAPIAQIGFEVSGDEPGTLYLDYVGWDGVPDIVLTRPPYQSKVWQRAWVNGLDTPLERWHPEPFRIIQNEARGLLITGTREWRDYQVQATITPHMAKAAGIAARVQGMKRYYAMLLCDDGKARLVKGERTLAEVDFERELGAGYDLRLQVTGERIQGWVNDQLIFDVRDSDTPYMGGGIALVIEEGRAATDAVTVKAISL